MDEATYGLVIMLLGCAIPLIICGYLVAIKQMRNLISGWDESNFSDPKAFGDIIGYGCMRMGIFIGFIAIAWYFKVITEMTLAITMIIVMFIEFFKIYKGYKLYKNNDYKN